MNCPKCGAGIPEGSVFCSECGAQMQAAQPEQSQAPQYVYGGNSENNQNTYYSTAQNQVPPDMPQINGTPYLIFAILATLFCCLPAGIAGIVFASKINSRWAVGDYAGAQESAKKAKMWTIISAVLGVIAIGISFALTMSGVIAGYGMY